MGIWSLGWHVVTLNWCMLLDKLHTVVSQGAFVTGESVVIMHSVPVHWLPGDDATAEVSLFEAQAQKITGTFDVTSKAPMASLCAYYTVVYVIVTERMTSGAITLTLSVCAHRLSCRGPLILAFKRPPSQQHKLCKVRFVSGSSGTRKNHVGHALPAAASPLSSFDTCSS